MKKLLLMIAMMLVSMSYASAAWKTYYVQEQEGQEYPSQSFFKIDWEGKYSSLIPTAKTKRNVLSRISAKAVIRNRSACIILNRWAVCCTARLNLLP